MEKDVKELFELSTATITVFNDDDGDVFAALVVNDYANHKKAINTALMKYADISLLQLSEIAALTDEELSLAKAAARRKVLQKEIDELDLLLGNTP